jgi:hypothetical protein
MLCSLVEMIEARQARLMKRSFLTLFMLAMGACSSHQSGVAKSCAAFDQAEQLPAPMIAEDSADKAFRAMMECDRKQERALSSDAQDSADTIAQAVLARCKLEVMNTEGQQNAAASAAEQTPAQREMRGKSLDDYVLSEARQLIVARRAAGCAGQNSGL